MNLPSDTPKMPKFMFVLGDLILLALAYFIHDGADHPWSGVALISTVSCVVVAVFLGVIPFVTDYARRQDEALDNRQRALQALSVTVAAASEQVSIAATGLNGIAEAAQDNFSKSEKLLEQLAEKIAALDARLAAAKRDDVDSAARIESAAKKIGKVAGELEDAVTRAAEAAKAPPAPPASPAAQPLPLPRPVPLIPEVPPVIASRIVEIKPAVAASDHPFEAPLVSWTPVPAPDAPRLEVASAEPVAAPEAVAVAEPEAPPAVAPAPRKRSPRKAAPPIETPAEVVAAPAADLILEAAPSDDSNSMPLEVPEPAVSADGATRLVVTAYIGIGNRLFIRGDGPGLSEDKGVPLTFVSIGKWRWETNDATSTVRFRLYKNDQVECTALGERSVEPGAQQELSAAF
jgi:hypothetical protein